jgi:mercuric reductase
MSSQSVDFDLLIIGSGSAAFSAAIAARELGLSVGMVEKGTIGGTCVNFGCVPSKDLLAAAASVHQQRSHGQPGISACGDVRVDWATVQAAKSELVGFLRREKYENLVQEYGWELIEGKASFGPGGKVVVDGKELSATHYLVATGAIPTIPPIEGLSECSPMTYIEALSLEEIPKDLLVIGGSYVGLELGQLFARFGSRVTIVEALDRLAPAEDPELSEVVSRSLAREGVNVRTATQVLRCSRKRGAVTAELSDGTTWTGTHVLVATGRAPTTADLLLDNAGIKTGPRGVVAVDEFMRTTNEAVWAAGDVTGAPQFVYVAAAQGRAAVANAFSEAPVKLDYSYLPRVTFTDPPLASAGITETEAARLGLGCHCRVLDASLLARSQVNRSSEGIIKVVANSRTGQVVGVHMACEHADEMAFAASLAIRARMTVDELASTWAPYLTMSEGIKLATEAFSRDPRKLSCCA